MRHVPVTYLSYVMCGSRQQWMRHVPVTYLSYDTCHVMCGSRQQWMRHVPVTYLSCDVWFQAVVDETRSSNLPVM